MRKLLSVAMITLLIVCTSLVGFANEKTTITIFHTNDTHANVDDDSKEIIGFAKMASYINEYKKTNSALVLDAGDMFQGLPFANLEKGQSIVPIVNKVGYDAMTIGNHEFDFGAENLVDIKSKLNFNMISANIFKDGKPAFEQSIIKEINGIKIGIFGLSTPETYYKTHPDNVKGYEFKDPITSSEDMIKDLKSKGAQVIIALTHLGVDEGTPTSVELAQKVKGIDVIIDGHSHTKLDNGKMQGDTLIASANTALKNIGKIDITIENGKIVDKKASLLGYEDLKSTNANADIVAEINKVKELQKPVLEKVIGTTKVDLIGEREVVRAGESNLGALATDAMLDLTKADIAITNGGGIRASIKAGNITMKDMITVFPFGNTVMVKDIKGSDIVKAIEMGVSDYPNPKGAFPHVAGMTYTLNTTKPVTISDVKVNGAPIENDKLYSVATNDFMAAGGDGYTMFKDYPIKSEYNTLMDTLLSYIEKKGSLDGTFTPRMTVSKVNVIDVVDTEHIIVVDKEVKVRDYAIEKGYNVDFNAQNQIITLQKDKEIITFKQGDVEFKVIKGDKNLNGKFNKAPSNKENYNYFSSENIKAIETMLAS